ncbi:MAG: GNAT family N-acetyltransferase [Ktedonobacterales bacterium]
MEQPASGAGGAIEVRVARPEDRAAVLAFCAEGAPDGDYIEYVWDEWLRDERGALLVATADGTPVGMISLRMLSDDEAWLQGVRVAPRARRHGVGHRLTSAALRAAHERGAVVARLLISQSNLASQGMVSGFGFEKVAAVLHYAAPAIVSDDDDDNDERGVPGTPDQPAPEDVIESDATVPPEERAGALGAQVTIAGTDDFERIWDWLERSTLAPLNGGLSFGAWTARTLTEPDVLAAMARGNLWLLEEWTIEALALLSESRDDTPGSRGLLHLRYVDGTAEGISRLALVLRDEAGVRGLATVDLWLPDLLILRDAMAGAGFTADDHPMWVFARDL